MQPGLEDSILLDGLPSMQYPASNNMAWGYSRPSVGSLCNGIALLKPLCVVLDLAFLKQRINSNVNGLTVPSKANTTKDSLFLVTRTPVQNQVCGDVRKSECEWLPDLLDSLKHELAVHAAFQTDGAIDVLLWLELAIVLHFVVVDSTNSLFACKIHEGISVCHHESCYDFDLT